MKPFRVGKSWRVQIRIKGAPSHSGTFPTRRDAEVWASRRSIELREEKSGLAKHTLHETIQRYISHVIDHRKSGANMALRLNAIMSFLPVHTHLEEITAEDFSKFRDVRLRIVKPGTVLKEMNYLNAMLNLAIKEWGWLRINPLSRVSKPKSPPHRTRVISDDEVALILQTLGEDGSKPVTLKQQCGIILQIALETGMRASEITSLEWSRVHLEKRFVKLLTSKNGQPRDVPLSRRAIELLKRMEEISSPTVFDVQSPSLDALFRRARDQCGLSGFTFHDARHTAATRLVLKGRIKDPLTLSKMFGWENPKQAMTYFNPTASDIAQQLDSV